MKIHQGIGATLLAFSLNLLAAPSQTLLAPPDLRADDQFGRSVAASGNILVVGSPALGYPAPLQGAVYVFSRNGSNWTQQARLVAPGGFGGDTFGTSVAIEGNTIAVGSPGDGTAGVAFVFANINGIWTYQQILKPSDSATFGNFGASVSISRNTVAVGAPFLGTGAVYVYAHDLVTGFWDQQMKLTPPDQALSFGAGLALEADTLFVGAPNTILGNGFGTGSGYIYSRQGATWTLTGSLLPLDRSQLSFFGFSMSINGSALAVGAPAGSNTQPGATYIFTQNNGQWTQQAKLIPTGAPINSWFGYSVSLNGGSLLVGAPNAASAYLFTSGGSSWQQSAQLSAADRGFALAVALVDGNTMAAGAPLAGTPDKPNSGVLYVFGR